MVRAVEWPRVLRMDKMHDLGLDAVYSEKVSDESKITPRLSAEFVSIIVTLEGIRRVESETLERC